MGALIVTEANMYRGRRFKCAILRIELNVLATPQSYADIESKWAVLRQSEHRPCPMPLISAKERR